ncbi:MAG: thioredoxin domain-containing protein, partial [bacterium]
ARGAAPRGLEMSLLTLRRMADGGMRDHLGGGFHRYSVDDHWHVPHFEKMLYDQAQLAAAYVEARQASRDESLADVARGTLDYVLRDLTSPEGAFYCAEDADSPVDGARKEGAFYVWTKGDIATNLSKDDAALFDEAYGVKRDGNAGGSDPRGELAGANVLFAASSPAKLAAKHGLDKPAVADRLARCRAVLFAARAKRPRPHLDDKVLSAWNGLMISALARAAAPLAAPRPLDAARRAAGFLLDHLRKPDGALLRRWRDSEAAIPAFLEDYAFVTAGFLDLYEAGGEPRWLDEAVRMQELLDTLCWDSAEGGYFSTDGRDPSLLARRQDTYDGAEPSGNSVVAMNLLRLARMTDRKDFADRAARQLAWGEARARGMPYAAPQFLSAVLFASGTRQELVLAGDPASPGVAALRRVARTGFHPDLTILYADGGEGQRRLSAWLPFVANMKPLNGAATAYLCVNKTCDLPVTDPAALARSLATPGR